MRTDFPCWILIVAATPLTSAFTPLAPCSTPAISSTGLFSTTKQTMTAGVLNRVTPDNVSMEIKDPVDPAALEQAKAILSELTASNANGSVDADALLTVAKRLKDVPEDATTFVVSKEQCKAAYEGLTETERGALTNIHGRVKRFAEMQRKAVVDMEMDIPGGKAGHTVSPCRGTFMSRPFVVAMLDAYL